MGASPRAYSRNFRVGKSRNKAKGVSNLSFGELTGVLRVAFSAYYLRIKTSKTFRRHIFVFQRIEPRAS